MALVIKTLSQGVTYGYFYVKRDSLWVRYGCWFFKGHGLGLDKTVSSSKHLVRG